MTKIVPSPWKFILESIARIPDIQGNQISTFLLEISILEYFAGISDI
jgi:hypothetical protein